jgi:hypothetical protein
MIKSARNRTESYHPLQGVIRKVYSGVFKGRKTVLMWPVTRRVDWLQSVLLLTMQC